MNAFSGGAIYVRQKKDRYLSVDLTHLYGIILYLMFISKSRYSTTFKTTAIVLVCLFCTNSVVLADPDTLAPAVGNPKIYQEMRDMMEERLIAHQDPIDEFIKQRANTAKGLSGVPYLEEEFMRYVNACGANNMLTRLKTTLTSAGGKIQVIFVKSEDDLPVFEGAKVWGHAGTYVTVFALETEKDSKEGRRKIIARLFHEMRARSTRAKELFDEKLKLEAPTTPEGISAFIRSARESFEKDNLQLQQQIEQSSHITSPLLAQEFANLTFAMHPDVMNRDYMMATKPLITPNNATVLEHGEEARRLFIGLLNLLNKNWWLIQDPGAGYRDKEALSVNPANNSVDEAVILKWTNYEFQEQGNEESKLKIAERIINSRIAMGKVKSMPKDDQDRLLELAALLGINVNTSLQEQFGPEEAKKASFDGISVATSKINITPEEARARLERNEEDTEEYLTAYPFSHNRGQRRFTSYTKEDKKNILRVLLPLLAELLNMPMDDHFSCDYSIGLMIEAQSRLGLYDLAQETVENTLTHNQHLIHPVNNEDKKEALRRFRSTNTLRIAEAKLRAGDFEGTYQLLHPTDTHHSWDPMSDRSEEAMKLMVQAGFIKDIVKYLRNESAGYWGSKRRCEVAENLARIGLFDAALTLIATDIQPEHEFMTKTEIGIQMARAGDINRARLILAELIKKDEDGFYKRPDTLIAIARLQQAMGADREKILQILALCKREMEKIRDIDRVNYGVKLAKLYFAVDPHKGREALIDEKERFFNPETHRYCSSADCFEGDFIRLFDTALKFGLYDEAQDILNRYRVFRKQTIRKEDSTKRADSLYETEYRLWQNMINARNTNKKPPMGIFEEMYYDFHGGAEFYFADFSEVGDRVSAPKIVSAVLKEADADSRGRSRNKLDNALWRILLYLNDSNPDEIRTLLKEMVEETLQTRGAEDIGFAKSIMAFLGSDFGRALYEDSEHRENTERFISEFLPKLSRSFASDMSLSSIEFKDSGDAVTNYPSFMRSILNFAMPRIHEKPQGLPVKQKITRSEIPVIDATGEDLVINGQRIPVANPTNLIGRTLEYRVGNKAIMLKFLKKDEDPANLVYEHDMMNFLYGKKTDWNLLGIYPRGVLRIGKIRSELFSGRLPISIAGKESPIELDINADGYVTCMAYEVPLDNEGHNPYIVYLNDPAVTPNDFKKAFGINVHDRFVMARHGLFDMEIIELFHNRESEDGRRYDWMVDVRHHQQNRHGAGRLNNITAATLYPNVRLSGPADLAGLAFIGDMIENTEITALADNRFRRLLNMFDRDKNKAHNYIASALLGDTLLSLALIPPTYLERRNELDYNTESKRKRTYLQEMLKVLFDESYRGYNDSELPYSTLGVDLDIQLIARQMAYFITNQYVVDYNKAFKKRPIPQDLFPGTTITQIEEGRGWRKEIGWDITNGVVCEIPTTGKTKVQKISKDLGPVNGPNPLQELVRALYIMTPIMTINWKADRPIGTSHLPAGSIYSIFKYLYDHDIMTADNAISGETLAKYAGEEHEVRQEALSFESIKDDIRSLLLHLRLIERAPGSETGKDARYYVPESVKKKSAEILPILKQFRGENLRAKAALLDQVYEEKIKPILESKNVKDAREALKTLPREWYENDLKVTEFIAGLSCLLQIENILDQDKSTFIFSEKVTFDNGLGVLLPKLAKSGMRVAVIATNDRQRALIDELNQGKPENERIVYADTVADIRTKVHTARYYYFKVTGDPDTDLQGITTFDITEIVKKIIDALGKISGIVERERIELLHEAARKFAEAA